MQILTINAGSSSVRLGLYGDSNAARTKSYKSINASQAVQVLTDFLADEVVSAVGHRIVHGGATFSAPVLITQKTLLPIEEAGKLAPLHNPVGLQWYAAAKSVLDEVPHVAVFDTAYFSDLPEVATEYGLPREISTRYGIRRYGFHGIAHECMHRAAAEVGASKIITLQLGSGCSITAHKNGRPVDTSMGFTPLEGLLMGTRAGDLDPGVVLHLLDEQRMDVETLRSTLNAKSGLLGVSGESADMEQLLASKSTGAKKAIELFCYRAQKYVGAFVNVLGGVDAIVFGGGIGENAPSIREAILKSSSYLGVALNTSANLAPNNEHGSFHSLSSKVKLLVVRIDEGRLIAEKTRGILK